MRSRGYGTSYNSRSRSSRGSSGSRSRPSSSSGYSNTHVNALLLQARRRAYIGGSIGRYGNSGNKHKVIWVLSATKLVGLGIVNCIYFNLGLNNYGL